MDFAVRCLFSAPLLGIAILMVTDPEGAARMVRRLGAVLQTMEWRMRGVPPPDTGEESAPGKKWPVVAMGVLLAAGAIYVLAAVRS